MKMRSRNLKARLDRPTVNYWMHAGAIRVGKDKMSKSLGNFKTIREELKTYSGEVIRYFLISSHYRSQVEYSPESLSEAQSGLDRFYQSLRGLDVSETQAPETVYLERFEAAMNDDFNTPEAIAVLFDIVRELNTARQSDTDQVSALAATLKQLGGLLGILQMDPEAYFKGVAQEGGLSDQEIDDLIVARAQARADKNWGESDRIRDLLAEHKIIVDDGKGGSTWRRG